jgi:T5SS/PEP-CTERM-associated repeat protein/autotransporter-associated beta strand protein
MARIFRVIATLVLLSATAPAMSQTKTWTGAAGIGWSTDTNWSPAGVPTASDSVVFPASASNTSSYLTADSSVASILFDAGSTGYTISTLGAQLLNVNEIAVSATTTATQTISLANVPSGNLLFTNDHIGIGSNAAPTAASAPTLVIGPNTRIGSPGHGDVLVYGPGTTTISGSFADASGANNQVTGGLTHSGEGILTLSGNGANLLGGLSLSGGTLRLDYSTNTAVKVGGGGLDSYGGADLVVVPNASTPVTQNVASTSVRNGHTEIGLAQSGALVTFGLGAINWQAGTLNVPSAGMSVMTTTTNTNGLLGPGPAFATIGGGAWAAQSGGSLSGVTGINDVYSTGTNTNVTIGQSLGGFLTNSLRFTANVGLNLTSAATLQSGGILVPTGVNQATITGAGSLTAAANGYLFVHAYGPLTINSPLVSSAGLIKTGTGTLTLGGNNPGLGHIYVFRGGLTVTDIAAVASTTGISFFDSVARGDESAALTFDLPVGANATFTQPIYFDYNGILIKQGAGALTLGAPYYLRSAPVVVYNGTLGITGGGAINNASLVQIGYYGTAAATVGGGSGAAAWNGTGELDLGIDATGTLTIIGGGTVTTGGMGRLGIDVSGTGRATVGGGTGSAAWNTGELRVGESGTGSLTVTGGGTVSSLSGVIATSTGGAGTVTVGGGTGAATWTMTGQLLIAQAGAGTLNITGGGTVTSGIAFIGSDSGGVGIVNVGGGVGPATWNNNGELEVGTSGTGTLNITGGGTVSLSGGSYVGAFPGSTGTVNVGGGIGAATWTIPSTLFVGSAGTGTLNLLAGGLVITPDLSGGNITSSVNFDGGTLRITATDSASNTINVHPTGGTLDLPTAGSTFTLTGTIAGTGTLTKTGPGTLVVSGTGTNFSGGMTVNAGRLELPNDAALGTATLSTGPLGTIRYTASASTSRTFSMAGTLEAPAGVTLTLNGATVGGGFLRGAGTFAVTGGATMSGGTTFASTTISQTGPGSYSNFINGGTLTIAADSAGPITMNGFSNEGSGSMTFGARTAVGVADFQSYGTININPANITQSFNETTLVTNSGTSQLYFNGGSRTFVGTPATAVFPSGPQQGQPTFVAGIDLNGKNAVVAGGLLVNNGYVEDSSNGFTGTATIVADFGSLVKGAGFFQNTVITQNGGKFQAGNSPGVASFGTFVLGPGGVSNYVFAVNDATGSAGPRPDAQGRVSGWSLVDVIAPELFHGRPNGLGDFSWTATPADKLTVSLQTLLNPATVGVDVPGLMDHFDPNHTYQWPAVEWTGSYAGPTDVSMLDASTAFDTTGFANSIGGRFGWSLDTSDHTLSLTYAPTAVPEPGSLALAGLAVGLLRSRWWRLR